MALWKKRQHCNVAKHSCVDLQFSSVQSLSRVWLFASTWTTARQALLSISNSQSSPKAMSIELVMPSNHLILCRSLLLLLSIPPIIRVFSNESTILHKAQQMLSVYPDPGHYLRTSSNATYFFKPLLYHPQLKARTPSSKYPWFFYISFRSFTLLNCN